MELNSERCHLWLAGQPEPVNLESASLGALSIDANGHVKLVLDKYICKWGQVGDSIDSLRDRKFDIIGYLPNLHKYLRMENSTVETIGHYSSGFAPSGFFSFTCVISNSLNAGKNSDSVLSNLWIPLGSLWPWLDHPMPEYTRGEKFYDVRYPVDEEKIFQIKNGTISIVVETSTKNDLKARSHDIVQSGWIVYKPNNKITVDDAKAFYFAIEDLLILLTDAECHLGWPEIEDRTGVLYCNRRRVAKPEISYFELWLLLPQIEQNFSRIVDNWLEMKETYGPAFHLYLGTRRTVELYPEHYFVNLIWGLEALYRRSRQASPKPRLNAKIHRVLDACKPLVCRRDYDWLAGILEREKRVTLAEMLQSLFIDIPLGVPDNNLNSFCGRCARLRNEISHCGGPKEGGEYGKFLLEIHYLARALDVFYHMAILKQIGVTDEQLKNVLRHGMKFFEINFRLQRAGVSLLKPDA